MPVCVMRDGVRLDYADEGAGQPILLVHGWATSGAFFGDLGRRLARRHRVIVPTLRGHGGIRPNVGELTLEHLGADLVDLSEALDLTNVIAVGWSMGAMALWSAAGRMKGRLAGLIVEDMSPRLVCDAAWSFGLGGAYTATDIDFSVQEMTTDWAGYVQKSAPRMFAPGTREHDPDLVSWTIEQMMEAEPAAMAQLWRSMATEDFRNSLAGLGCPMLVLRGAESQIYPEGAAAFIAANGRRSEFANIPGAGHVPHLEAPDIFLNHVEAFARALRGAELRSGGAVP